MYFIFTNMKYKFTCGWFFLQLSKEKYDFFPMNRALSLTLMDEDSTESKIDELLQYVLALVQKQKEEVFVSIPHQRGACISHLT